MASSFREICPHMKRYQRLHGLIHSKSLLFRMPENHIVGHDVVPGAFHAGVFLPKYPTKLLIGRMIQLERFPAYHHDKKDLFLRENRKILSEFQDNLRRIERMDRIEDADPIE